MTDAEILAEYLGVSLTVTRLALGESGLTASEWINAAEARDDLRRN